MMALAAGVGRGISMGTAYLTVPALRYIFSLGRCYCNSVIL